MSADSFIAIAWVAVVCYAIVATLTAAPKEPRAHFSKRFVSPLLLFIALVLLAGALRFPPFSDYLYALSWPIEWLGVLVTYTGLVLAYKAQRGRPWKKVTTHSALLILAFGTALTLGRVDAFLALAFLYASFRL